MLVTILLVQSEAQSGAQKLRKIRKHHKSNARYNEDMRNKSVIEIIYRNFHFISTWKVILS